ncbi:hypothetical protein F5Y14DRAFT_253426 [Nemania sp. NC0429]|nr:hypothetical protein F5Y14DRAFT_253426 [Nemania sp. NC0429]
MNSSPSPSISYLPTSVSEVGIIYHSLHLSTLYTISLTAILFALLSIYSAPRRRAHRHRRSRLIIALPNTLTRVRASGRGTQGERVWCSCEIRLAANLSSIDASWGRNSLIATPPTYYYYYRYRIQHTVVPWLGTLARPAAYHLWVIHLWIQSTVASSLSVLSAASLPRPWKPATSFIAFIARPL